MRSALNSNQSHPQQPRAQKCYDMFICFIEYKLQKNRKKNINIYIYIYRQIHIYKYIYTKIYRYIYIHIITCVHTIYDLYLQPCPEQNIISQPYQKERNNIHPLEKGKYIYIFYSRTQQQISNLQLKTTNQECRSHSMYL